MSFELLDAQFWHIHDREKAPHLRAARNTYIDIITLSSIFSLCTVFIYQSLIMFYRDHLKLALNIHSRNSHCSTRAGKRYLFHLLFKPAYHLKVSELPWWLKWLSVCLQCGRPGFDPWVRKIPWRRKWQSTPVLLPGKSHGQRSLVGYSPWGHKLKTKFLPHIYQSTTATNANIEKEGQPAGESEAHSLLL